MKYIFLASFLLLLGAGVVTTVTEPDLRSDVPVLYWVTDRNPARIAQVAGFHEWLVERGHVTEDGKPMLELRLDTASRDPSKQIIQSIAGVAGDIMDCDVGQMHALGVLEDVTDDAARLGFGVDQTYPALEPALTRNGRQYGFPCNVGILSMWSNPATFAAVGLEPPAREWSIEEFERLGKEYVRRANEPGERQTHFFVSSMLSWSGPRFMITLHRAKGLSIFNETLTAATTDDPRYAWVLSKCRQWTYEDNIMPTAAEASSLAVESGYGSAEFPLFVEGRYAMIVTGRWALIRMRDFAEPPEIKLSYYPVPPDGYGNDLIATRAAAVYRGGKNKDLAVLFLAYLASESYNNQIVADADALPPNPLFAESEAFDRPPDWPNEWDVHAPTHEAAQERAIAESISPFIPRSTVARLAGDALQEVMSDPQVATPEEAAATLQEEINHQIAMTVRESATLRQRFDEAVELQKKIDTYRAEGRPIPIEWIANPFHRRYYLDKGWATRGEAAMGDATEAGDES
ncbi:MAG: extracellular solute-binding protein [Planctomycetota bacterium]